MVVGRDIDMDKTSSPATRHFAELVDKDESFAGSFPVVCSPGLHDPASWNNKASYVRGAALSRL
jgi:hypothetical protein